jgi:predicted O-methyltransferase YrrM
MSGLFHLHFGLASALAAIAGYLVVRDDARRRRLSAKPLVIVSTLLAGALASAVLLGSQLGLSGALVGIVVAALMFADASRLSSLLMLDVAAVAAAAGIGLGTLAEFRGPLSLEGIALLLISYWLWQEGHRSIQWQRPRGIVFGEFLVLYGVCRTVAGYLLGNAMAIIAGLISVLAGAVLLAIIVPRFLRTREEHRIIADVSTTGESLQPEYTPATPECPHPELWKMYDSMSAEAEVLDFLKSLVITLKPNLVVETGTFIGVSTLAIAEGLKQNGFGQVITVEYDPKVFARAKERIDGSGLTAWIDARNHSSLDLEVSGPIDLLFSDSDINIREREVRHLLPQISPTGLILIHDASSHQRVVREAALRLEAEGLISVVLVPTPRGLVLAQKRAGRR